MCINQKNMRIEIIEKTLKKCLVHVNAQLHVHKINIKGPTKESPLTLRLHCR